MVPDSSSTNAFFVAEFVRIQTFVKRHPISHEIGYADVVNSLAMLQCRQK